MIYYKVGCNFDYELLDEIGKLNIENRHAKVDEFYGSDKKYGYLTARPEHRLPDINDRQLERYIDECKKSNIDFNYTMNSIFPGPKKFLIKKKKEIISRVIFLENIGVKTITVSNPILAEFIREASDTIGIEVSTIAHIDTITQMKVWKTRYNISKICSNILMNRRIRFLSNAARYCNDNDLVLNLIVNEFCCFGGSDEDDSFITHCIFRDSCYLCHSSDVSQKDSELINSYPMSFCTEARKEPTSWLKAPFIRPEDIPYYKNIGINHFKVTGRTSSTNHVLKIVKAYMKGEWKGNLLFLWKPLETIGLKIDEFDYNQPFFIDSRGLKGFLDHWFKNTDFDCSNEVCGDTCKFCEIFFKEKIRNDHFREK